MGPERVLNVNPPRNEAEAPSIRLVLKFHCSIVMIRQDFVCKSKLLHKYTNRYTKMTARHFKKDVDGLSKRTVYERALDNRQCIV
jgi:hypothetical protein